MHDAGGQREQVQEGVFILHRLVAPRREAVAHLVPRALVDRREADHHVRLPRTLLRRTNLNATILANTYAPFQLVRHVRPICTLRSRQWGCSLLVCVP